MATGAIQIFLIGPFIANLWWLNVQPNFFKNLLDKLQVRYEKILLELELEFDKNNIKKKI